MKAIERLLATSTRTLEPVKVRCGTCKATALGATIRVVLPGPQAHPRMSQHFEATWLRLPDGWWTALPVGQDVSALKRGLMRCPMCMAAHGLAHSVAQHKALQAGRRGHG